ncbi:MAG: zinc-binding dehydrogenase [Ignavibacteria bacterium]|nr:zinc-binding dehydrogenase [Ignavibacteria bacterium]
MKALVLERTGKPEDLKYNLVIKEIDKPHLKKNEVLVNIKYAALNHRDLFITQGLYAGIKTPIILGSDGAGIIADANGFDFKNGEEVIINPTIDWASGNDKNEDFQNKDFRILGLPDNGTLAEYVCVPAKNVYKKPNHLSLKESAAIPLAGLTAYRACFVKGSISKGDNVLITGIGGGVATFALIYSLAAGANVFVVSGTREKIEFAIRHGAIGGINYNDENWEKRFKEIHPKINTVIDGAGGETLAKCLDICTEGGTIVSYGATSGAVKNFEMRRIFWKQLKLFGTTMGSDKDFFDMLTFIEQNKIVPIIDKEFDLQNGADAFFRMNRREQTGKIVVKI